jgi:hypothetical protein
MNISGDLHEFTQRNVSEAPIRERLQAHMRGEEGHCTQQATGYRYELARRPTEKAEELLLEYRYAHGQLPLCNDDLVDI